MGRKKKAKKTSSQEVVQEKQSEKSYTLIFWGVILSMSSIGLLIFVISQRIFRVS